MSDEKNKYNKAYDEGYNEAKKDDSFGEFSHNLTKGIRLPGEDEKKTQSYNAGYADGTADRYEDGDSHYSGGTSESSSSCFITTATLNSIGKSDNCEELNTFRNFRDSWLINQKDGKNLILEYYKIAPTIVTIINSKADSKRIYNELWKKSIEPCLNLIKQNHYVEAKKIYCDVVVDLKKKFLDK